jgi:hypothetical protein
MAVNNLGELRTLVKDWSNRTDISNSVIDSFINIAQDRANRILRLPILEGFSTITVTNNALLLPTDYLEAKSLVVTVNGKAIELERKDLAFVTKQQNNQGNPKYFARKQSKFVIAPDSNVSSADLYYYYVAANLVNDADTNWFVEHGTDLLLYGALSELSLYTKNTEEALQYEAKFKATAQDITRMADDADWSGSTIGIIPKR